MALGQIRIIGGKWRGRKLTVPKGVVLRPTPDRVRETVFNWLNLDIADAHCLDAYAGTGALGFEALSRGAAHVVFIDQAHDAISTIKNQLKTFQTEAATVIQGTLIKDLKALAHPFNIVFLDPPYKENLLLPSCQFLEEKNCLANKAYIYLESNRAIDPKTLPKNWELIKAKKAGQVYYHLAYRGE